MGRYVLPDLAYDYGALEPHVSGRIMELHHDKHHATYVKGANEAIEGLQEARAKSDFARIAQLERALAFNVSGHVLHSLFWRNLSPDGGDRPEGTFAQAIDRDPQEVARQLERSGAVVQLAGDIIRSKALDLLVERSAGTSGATGERDQPLEEEAPMRSAEEQGANT